MAIFFFAPAAFVSAQAPKFGVGLRVGAARLENDVKLPPLRFEASGLFSFALKPHLRLGAEAGFADLALGADPDTVILRMVPAALHLTLRLAPYSKVTPFVTLGGGGVNWKHLDKRSKKTIQRPGQKENHFDYFLQTSGGLEMALSSRVSWTLGATYRYGLTDDFDMLDIGDQNDAVLSAFTGFTFNIGKISGDADRDGVLDRYDLDGRRKEDRDGYLDHDGVPDRRMAGNIAAYVNAPDANTGSDNVPPIVIHQPILHATAGKDLRLTAEIFENQSLRKAAIIYRPFNVSRWLVEPMNPAKGKLHVGVIPGTSIHKTGLEYCIVAVDEAISGVGYSGVPDRPNFVRVHGKETGWRLVTGLAAAAGWGAASYLVFRKQ
ncbi:MAG: PorT family protein [candidate division KSB1 bacterium]|nr:PorT family protein [candidate division KSB1 bacterium]MDZ7368513.1 PorT family protein [candidate division KSB1 bacterium]MDZ7406259.1 PorT family protein [candidate division KSB1 bacterium]